jgi:ankyrin repeat protein
MSKKSNCKPTAGQAASAPRFSVQIANDNLWNACVDGVLSSSDASVMRVQAAIAAGADVNFSSKGTSCLQLAAATGNHELVSLLLTAGADKEVTTQEGGTALIIAAQYDRDKCVERLLTAGADKEATLVNGMTALSMASQLGHKKCVKLLLTADVDKEAKTHQGATSVIIAAQHGHNNCLELLLNAGCKVNALSSQGISALLMAVKKGHIDCVRTLVRCGADVLIKIDWHALDDVADYIHDADSSIAEELKAALRSPAEKRRRCAQCDKTTSEKLQKCSACRKVYYCNRECQVAHWKRHKPACEPIEL